MSAGAFLDAFYELNSGSIAGIRIQPETAALVLNGVTNTIPAGPANLPVLAKATGGRRSYGINCRLVRVKFTGTPPTGYKEDSVITLPWLQADTYEALVRGQTGTYLTASVKLVGKSPEEVR